MKEIYVVTGLGVKKVAFENVVEAKTYLAGLPPAQSKAVITPVELHPSQKKFKDYPIPKEHTVKILEAMDALDNCDKTGRRMEAHAVFSILKEVFPNIDLTKGKWLVDVSVILAPILQQEIEDA